MFAAQLSAQTPVTPVTATLKISGEKTVAQHKLVRLQVDNPSPDSAVLWNVEPDDAADMLVFNGELIFTGPPGIYRVQLTEITIVAGKPVARQVKASVKITAPTPPVPPPSPPGPTPPTPADPLLPTLQAVFAADSVTQDKAAKAKMLAAVYRNAAATTIHDKAITTTGQLLEVMAKAGSMAVPLPALKPCREVIAAELKTKLPITDQPLTDVLRTTCGEQYARMYRLLEALQ